jgi:transcriptional regulator with XRE-family HTH domain
VSVHLPKGNEKVKKQNTSRAQWVAGESVKVWLKRVLCLQSKKDVIAFAASLKDAQVSRNTIKKYLDEEHYAIERKNILTALKEHKYNSKDDGKSYKLGRYGYKPIDEYSAKDNSEAMLKKLAKQRINDYWNIIEHQCKKVGTQCDRCGGVYLRKIKNDEVKDYRIIKDMSSIAGLTLFERFELAKNGPKGVSPPSGAEGPPYFGATIYLSAHVDKQFGSINANKSNHFEVEKTLCEYCLRELCDFFNAPVSVVLSQIKKERNWTMSKVASALDVSQSNVSRLMRSIGEAPIIKFIKPETLNRMLLLNSEIEQLKRSDDSEIEQHEDISVIMARAKDEEDNEDKDNLRDKKNSVEYLRKYFSTYGYDSQFKAEEITTNRERRSIKKRKSRNKKEITFLPDAMIRSRFYDNIAVFLSVEPNDIYSIIATAKNLNATHIWYKHYNEEHEEEMAQHTSDYPFIYRTNSWEEEISKEYKHVCLDLSRFPPAFCEIPINYSFLTYRTNEETKLKKYEELEKAINKTMHDMANSKGSNSLQECKIQLDIEKIQLLKKDSEEFSYYQKYQEDIQEVEMWRKMTKPSPVTIIEYLFQWPPIDILQKNFQMEICRCCEHLEEHLEQQEKYRLAEEYDVHFNIISKLVFQHSIFP